MKDNWVVVGILFAISIAVWIFVNLFRNREEDQHSTRPRRPASDLDNFLAEIERRKRRAEASRERPAPPQAIAVPPPRRAAPPQRPPSPRSPAARPPAARPVVVPLQRVEPISPVLLEVVEPVARPLPSAPSQRLPEVLPVSPQAPAQGPAPAAILLAAETPPAGTLQDLLRTPQSLRTVLLLREVLGPPVCRRRLGNGIRR
jgi:hypothetical protein